ncbi:hypothetical protein [Mesobacillus subterraneus]|uniref:Uncharacterized protein n=1 Tax=Mesobacillus subterraneus TaxID=285983 RepID=A0A3R9F291_9BACI|nr:hypothetical protein [Mesobacillus subterraneus]RSD27431.1 hypothetical protein EJA10_10155 [Mesobacillus subterraneus]
MQYVIGIEAKPLLLELDDFRIFLLTIAPPQLVHGNLYIYEEVKDAEEAAELLSDADLMEEKHQLARTDGTRGEEFYDYGFHAAGVFFFVS